MSVDLHLIDPDGVSVPSPQRLNQGCNQPHIQATHAVFKSDDGADERIAPSLDVCDVPVAKLAVTKRLADCSHVDTGAAFRDGDVRPDVIHQLLLRDDLTWAAGKIGQDIQRPVSEGKRATVTAQHPLANRKFEG